MSNKSMNSTVCGKSRMSVKCLMGCMGLIGLGIAAWVSAREYLSADKSSQIETVVKAPSRIHALGRLEPRGTVLRISPPSGNEGARIGTLLVDEGQDVETGDLLAVLDVAIRREAAVKESQARLDSSEAKLDQIRAGAKAGDISAQASLVDRMDAELHLARKELERAKQLTQQKVMTAENLEHKELNIQRATLEAQRSRAQLDSLREVRDVDVKLQEREVAAASAALERAREELEAAKVRSPISGRILKIHSRPGERVGDRGILQLGDVAHMQAVAEVFEGDVQGLKLGQQARVRLSSDGRETTGVVEQVGLLVARKDVLSNDPVSDTDARVLEVRIAISPKDIPSVERLSNARVEVSIDLSEPAAPIPTDQPVPCDKSIETTVLNSKESSTSK